MLTLYLVGIIISESNDDRLYPVEYTPFVVWSFYFAYMFFPSRGILNPKGRNYFYTILKKILLTPFVKINFLLTFATDQAVSFVTAIKDFAYTVCFFKSEFTV